MTATRVYLRKVHGSDRAEIVALAHEGRALHDPWISPPRTTHAFRLYLRRTQREDHEHDIQVFLPYTTIFRVEVHPEDDDGQRRLGFLAIMADEDE